MACPKLKDIVEELHDVKTKWNVIGIQLEVPRTTLKKIQSTHRDDPEEAFSEMIGEWLDQTKEPSWSAIVTALRSRSVGAWNLADNVERNKCPEDHDSGEPLMDVAVRKEEVPYNNTGELQMIPNHSLEEVPPQVIEKIRSLAESFNNLRILTYHHLENLKVNPDELRVIVCNPERQWEGDDHKNVCLAKSISVIFCIISHRRYLNWQKYDLLGEIIGAYGDAILKGQFDGYCEKIRLVENETPLNDIKNIVFTPLGTKRLLMKVPIPNQIAESKLTMAVVRDVQNGFKKNGYHVYPHHVGTNSPLAIFFIVPQQYIPLPAMKKLKMNPEKIEDRVVYSFSEEEALELMNIQPLAIPDKEAPPLTMDDPSSQPSVKVQVFDDDHDILHKGSTTVVCKGKFNHLACAAKYIHPELTASDSWQIEQFQKGCDFLRNCHHPNIIMFLGLDQQHPRAPVLLTELMDESLDKFLNRSQVAVPLHIQVDICADVAQGLDYIHTQDYIYGDLNASNVLLRSQRAKIGGLMALTHKSTSNRKRSFPPGSPLCMPMRAFSFSQYDEKIDSFSFGVLAMHIATRKEPSPKCTSADFASISELERYETSLEKVASDHPLHPHIRSCLNENDKDRPSAADLIDELSATKERPEYIESRRSSECMSMEIESMKSEMSKMKRKSNNKQRRIKGKVKQLEADIQEKDRALQQMKHEKDALISEHQHTVALLKQSELLLLALNYCFQKTHLDYETAKEKAKSLSNKEKEANEKMKIIVKEKTQLEKKNAEEMHTMAKKFNELEIVAGCHLQEKMALETKYDSVKRDLDTATMEVEQKDKKIKDLKQRCLSIDASYAELLDKYIALGGELET